MGENNTTLEISQSQHCVFQCCNQNHHNHRRTQRTQSDVKQVVYQAHVTKLPEGRSRIGTKSNIRIRPFCRQIHAPEVSGCWITSFRRVTKSQIFDPSKPQASNAKFFETVRNSHGHSRSRPISFDPAFRCRTTALLSLFGRGAREDLHGKGACHVGNGASNGSLPLMINMLVKAGAHLSVEATRPELVVSDVGSSLDDGYIWLYDVIWWAGGWGMAGGRPDGRIGMDRKSLTTKLRSAKAQGSCHKQTALVEAEACMALTVRVPMFHWSLQPLVACLSQL